MHSRLLAILVLALLAWGGIHAFGAYRYNHNPWRAVMVAGCMCAFLGFWGLLLATRRNSRKKPETPGEQLK